MDLRSQSFRCFVILAEEASFTRAAQRLNLTQSALSMRIRDIEQQLQVSLFHRSSRTVVLTSEGAELLDQARRIVNETDRFQTMVTTLRSHPERPLTFGMPITPWGTDEWMRWINRFRATEPRLQVRIVRHATIDVLSAVREEQIDIGFFVGHPPEDLPSLVMGTMPLILLVPAEWPLAKKPVLDLADVAGLRVAAFDRDINPGYFDQILGRLAQAGAELEPAPEGITGAGFAVRARVAGVSFHGAPPPKDDDRMVRREIEGLPLAVDLCAVHAPGTTRRVVRRFWESTKQRLATENAVA